MIPAAKKEGEVEIYGRTLKPDQVKAFSKAISDFYGFPIKLNMSGGSHTAKSAEIALAVKKGRRPDRRVLVVVQHDRPAGEGQRAGRFRLDQGARDRPRVRTRPNTVRSHDISLAYVSYNTKLVKPSEARRVTTIS